MKQGSCVEENSADELFGQLTFVYAKMAEDNITEEFCLYSSLLQTLVYARIPVLKKREE